jgi:hypothetical protein
MGNTMFSQYEGGTSYLQLHYNTVLNLLENQQTINMKVYYFGN